MGGWICGENDLDYPKIGIEMARINSKIGIEMARINWRGIYWDDILGYLDPYQHHHGLNNRY